VRDRIQRPVDPAPGGVVRIIDAARCRPVPVAVGCQDREILAALQLLVVRAEPASIRAIARRFAEVLARAVQRGMERGGSAASRFEQPLEPLLAVFSAEEPVIVPYGNTKLVVLPDGREADTVILAGELAERLAGTRLRRLGPGAVVGKPGRVILQFLGFGPLGYRLGPDTSAPAAAGALLPPDSFAGVDRVAVVITRVTQVGSVCPRSVFRHIEDLLAAADFLVAVVLSRSAATAAGRLRP